MTAKPQWRVILVAVDQLAGAFIPDCILPGCDEDDTISSRLGKALRGDHGPSWAAAWWVRWTAAAVDWLALRLAGQADHCRMSIEDDEGPRALDGTKGA